MARMMTSEEAANRLGVKVTTLYVYVSRGLLESHPDPGSRRSLFAVEDVERLATRSRSGRRDASRLAVVTTSITQLDERGPVHRGRPAVEMASTASFEQVAELLWRSDADELPWTARRQRVPTQLRFRDRLPWSTVMAGAADPFRADLRPEAVVRVARALIATLVGSLSNAPAPVPALVLDDGTRVDDSIAARLTLALLPHSGDDALLEPTVNAVNTAMVLLADHELATSTLAVRVAASTRADPYDAVLAGLGTSAGTLHSAASDVVLELLAAAERDGVEIAMGDTIRRLGMLPGFGHGAYPDGDPRATALLERTRAVAAPASRRLVDAVIETAAAQGLPAPNIDLALAALAHASGMPPGSTPTLFSIARVSGWIAHYLEELDEAPLRFRARAVHTTET